MNHPTRLHRWLVIALLMLGLMPLAGGPATASEAVPPMYVVDFLAASGEAVDINEAGQVIGERNIDEGCDPFCVIVPSEAGVWDERGFTALPMKPAWSWVILSGISGDGWIAGTAYSFSDVRGIVWKPNGAGYDIVEIGNLPDTDYSTVAGIDDHHRVIGYNNRIFPLEHKPFVWSEADGVVELTDLGFPDSTAVAISPGGTVAFAGGWYQLDSPGIVHQNADPPPNFQGPGGLKVAINDAGDQALYIARNDSDSVSHAFRYFNTGEWQELGISAEQHTSNAIGGITDNLDMTGTLRDSGWVAEGPGIMSEDLAMRLSPAYGDATAYTAGPLSNNGQMAARLGMGKAPRVVRLVPGRRCQSDCIRVRIVRFRSRFVDDPADPGRCVGTAHTRSHALLRVVDETRAPLAGVEITGRFLTEYRLDGVVTGTTDDTGGLRFSYRSAPCTGAMTFLVSNAELPGSTFDRTVGNLLQWLIPDSF